MSNFISVKLDNPSRTYLPGSNVTGKVYVFLAKPKKVRNITLFAAGRAKTTFDYQSVLPCGFEKTFFEYFFVLWKPTNGENEVIPAGKYYFEFSFKIPSDCLPNFEGQFGNIQYSIKAKMDIPLQLNLKSEQHFNIESILPSTIINKIVKQHFTDQFSASEVINVEVSFYFDF
uniref:Arrestin-like N-terminal domain-containing protein n=1 Tax=Panagrolaimus sp. ES5 TaxID=591445 RepID=A0AC34G3B2_9BILA